MSNKLSGEKKKKSRFWIMSFVSSSSLERGIVLCCVYYLIAVRCMHCYIWLWQITLMVNYIWECMGMVDLKEQHIQSRQELFL